MLIVIAILGILAAVAIPNVSTYLTNGKLSAANTEVNILNLGITSYQADHNGDNPATIADILIYISPTTTIKGSYTITAGVLAGVTYAPFS